jgi:hypothetical protein
MSAWQSYWIYDYYSSEDPNRSKGLFVSASWELLGCGSRKLKQTASFWGELFGCRKAMEASIEWKAEKEEKQSFHSFGLKFMRKAQKKVI